MAENVVTRYDPHFNLGMRVMTLNWCFYYHTTSVCFHHHIPVTDQLSLQTNTLDKFIVWNEHNLH
jgi:hypothetical protein